MKKTTGIIWVLVLNYIKLGVGILTILGTAAIYAMPASNAFRTGFFSAYTGGMQEMTPELLAEMIGGISFPLSVVVITLVYIYQRKYKTTIVLICLQMVIAITRPIGIIMPFIMLIIILASKPSKNYLNNMPSSIEEKKQVV